MHQHSLQQLFSSTLSTVFVYGQIILSYTGCKFIQLADDLAEHFGDLPPVVLRLVDVHQERVLGVPDCRDGGP